MTTQPVCGAKTRGGGTCKNPPVTGAARCRMHGGSSPQALGPCPTTPSTSPAPSHPTQPGTSRPVAARESGEERVRAYAEAIWGGEMPEDPQLAELATDEARAVMAVADAEQEALQAEVERVDSERSAALTRTTRYLNRTIDMLRSAEAERDRLAGVVERVRALADEFIGYFPNKESLSAILDADAPEASEEGRRG